MKHFSLTVLILSLGCFLQSFSQSRATLDSLQNALRTYDKKDTIRVNLLNEIAYRIYGTESDKALVILKESKELSDDLKYQKGRGYSTLYLASVLSDKGSYQLSLQYYQEALTAFESTRDKVGISSCYHNFGRVYYYLSDYEKAETNYQKAILFAEEAHNQRRLSISLVGMGTLYSKLGEFEKGITTFNRAKAIDEKLGNKKGVSNSLVNLGTIYRRQAKFPLALECFHKSLEIKEEIGDVRGAAAVLSNLGGVYANLERDDEALSYYNKASVINEKLKDKDGMVNVWENTGLLEMKHGNRSRARELFEKGLALSKELGNKSKIADCLTNMALLEIQDQNYELALQHLNQAAAIDREIGSERELSYCLLKIGRIYYIEKDYDKALQYANQSAALADKLKVTDFQKDISLLLSEIYFEQKQYKLAYEKRFLHKKLNDSIFSVKNIDKAAQIKYRYVYKKREKSLKEQVKSKDSQLEASQIQNMWWISGSLILMVVLGFVLALLKIRKVRMENKQLLTEQKLHRSQMNPHFIFNSLQNIRSLIHNRQNEEAMDYLNKFSKLTRQILESSNENYTSLAEEIELIKNYVTIQQLLYNHSFDFTLSVDGENDVESIFMPLMLTQPFIENAIKHGLSGKKGKGMLEMGFHLNNDKLYFEIYDNGTGFGTSGSPENHKSMATDITKKRLIHYSKNKDYIIHAENILDRFKKVVGAKVSFEIPYIYEN